MTTACRNRNRPRVNSQIGTSTVETESYTVIEVFIRSIDKPLASDGFCIP